MGLRASIFLFITTFLFNSSFAQIAVKGEIVYTMEGAPVKNGLVLINNGLIEWVGSASDRTIPTNYTIYEGKVVTPGLFDGRTTAGLTGLYNYNHDQEQLEKSDPFQPELRAVDAFNYSDELLKYLSSFGITTLHTGHAPGALASGQSMIVKTLGEYDTGQIVDSVTAVLFSYGSGVTANFKKPGTRSKAASMLREEFLKANNNAAKNDTSKKDARNLRAEIMEKVVKGEVKAIFTVHRANDILTVLRICDEFGIKPIIDGASEAYMVIEQLKSRNIPVILHPTMQRAYGETQNLSFETAAILDSAGILFAIQSGYEGYVPKVRVVLFEAGVAAGYGLNFESALASITINPAKILGVENSIGSLKAGKHGDVVIFNGDPFEYTTKVCLVIQMGKVVSEECR